MKKIRTEKNGSAMKIVSHFLYNPMGNMVILFCYLHGYRGAVEVCEDTIFKISCFSSSLKEDICFIIVI